ncbi:MAG: virulence RhuM family protein [Clostridia bacterium]|nr:virulence RhuM family protein [Clostridia bacterium]
MNNIENLKDLIIYQSQNNENISVEVLYDEEDFFLTQKSMAKLFNVEVNTINYHLKEIFESQELEENRTIRKIRTVQNEGSRSVSRELSFYSLDAIIAVGYRVNSKEATEFRIWATNTLKEYIKKGFVLNDNLLKNGPKFGKDYFKELLDRIRSIRTSERRIWQQITDIFAECSIDYDKNSEITHTFYAMIQNKFHFAITGNTAAEIIYQKADHTKKNMGLTTWKNSPDGRILKSDVMIAKNYLEEKQIKRLERAVTGYFDYIEDLVERENTFTMEEFSKSVNEFLEFRKYDILKDNGKISRKMAEEKAEKEYNEFNKTQKITSDFDKLLLEAKRIENKNE